jgi:hypothetical protein
MRRIDSTSAGSMSSLLKPESRSIFLLRKKTG